MLVGIIPVRKGSKTIPNKAFYNLFGFPMLQYTIIAAELSELKRVIVAGDYEPSEIEPLISNHDKVVYIQRPTENCNGDLPSTVVLDYLYDRGTISNYDSICFLQPTSPLRNYKDINMALLKYFISLRDSLVSVTKGPSIKKLYKKNGTKYIKDYSGYQKEKDEILYIRNSAIYIFPLHMYLESKSIFEEYPELYIMDSFRSIDVDDLEDLEHVKKIILNNGRLENE